MLHRFEDKRNSVCTSVCLCMYLRVFNQNIPLIQIVLERKKKSYKGCEYGKALNYNSYLILLNAYNFLL